MSTVDEPAPRRRGRPRESVDPGAPPSEWLDGLSPTALHIVAVARSLLLAENLRIAHHRAGGVRSRRRPLHGQTTLHQPCRPPARRARPHAVRRVERARGAHSRHTRPAGATRRLHPRTQRTPGREQLQCGLRGGRHSWSRDPIVREKIAIAYEVARDSTREVMDLSNQSDAADEAQRTLASIVLAVADGISLQLAADPGAVDKNAAFEMLADMVRLLLKDKTGD